MDFYSQAPAWACVLLALRAAGDTNIFVDIAGSAGQSRVPQGVAAVISKHHHGRWDGDCCRGCVSISNTRAIQHSHDVVYGSRAGADDCLQWWVPWIRCA